MSNVGEVGESVSSLSIPLCRRLHFLLWNTEDNRSHIDAVHAASHILPCLFQSHTCPL
jgi:hypothetical protein